jgi:N-carbamoylputrescine amidase
MNRTPVVSIIQRAASTSRVDNLEAVVTAVEAAIGDGADIIVPPELFELPYFPQREQPQWFSTAQDLDASDAVSAVCRITRGTSAVVPVSFHERAGRVRYNSVALVEAGEVRTVYRKSHIPDGPGYEEKYYFAPGDVAPVAVATAHGCIGIGICWDQWFPEVARSLSLDGADLLVYPTAIGSDPADPTDHDSSEMWRAAMVGHAVCNHVHVAAANRVGREDDIEFYGTSFIADHRGRILVDAGRGQSIVVSAELDFDRADADRDAWGFHRDRRPELYSRLAQR